MPPILTIGNEVVSGDTENTNASWLGRRLEELRAAPPMGSWRRRYRTRESLISPALVEATARWPEVLVGSYPSFGDEGPEVEVVLKSSDPDLLVAARTWLEAELDRLT